MILPLCLNAEKQLISLAYGISIDQRTIRRIRGNPRFVLSSMPQASSRLRQAIPQKHKRGYLYAFDSLSILCMFFIK